MAPWRSTGSARVARAMAAVPRVGYLPHGQRGYAAQDRALPIGFDATCSQPSTVAAMLELLEVPAGASVLDVGSGSGWTTAILAHLVGPTGSVRGVEIVSELVDLAAERLRAADLPWASVALAREGVLGLPEAGPFNRILVSADGGQVPGALVAQLVEGGRMVLPAAGRLVLVELVDGAPRTSYAPGRYAFVPLR